MNNLINETYIPEEMTIDGRVFGTEEALIQYQEFCNPAEKAEIERVAESAGVPAAFAFIYRKYFPNYFQE